MLSLAIFSSSNRGILHLGALTRSLITIALVAIALWGVSVTVNANDTRLTATVDYPKSGNTLELLFDVSPAQPVTTIRLAAIEAPDAQQTPWGPQARDCLNDLNNQIIHLELVEEKPDAYERLWAYGWLGKKFINEHVLVNGCAYLAAPAENSSPYYRDLLYAQEEARLLGLGIWNPENPLRETAETFRRRSPTP